MALVLRHSRRRLLLRHPAPLSTSSSPPDPRARRSPIPTTPRNPTTPRRRRGVRRQPAPPPPPHRRGVRLPPPAPPRTHSTHRLGRLLDELRGLGLLDELRHALESDAEGLLAMDPGEPTHLLELLRGLRCRPGVRDQVLAPSALRAAVAARRRVELLHARGLTRRDALGVLAREPRAVLYSVEDVERKVEFLVEAMGFQIGWLVQYPEFLGVSLDNWIMPRHNVIEHLRSVGGLGDPVEMKHYVRFSRRRFYNMFVKPYPECQRIFGGLVREREEKAVRRRHPTGLWKLFTPKKHERNEDDVKNMKLLVESLC
ncbi:hypothetical protein ACP4OV_028075 [Aristida adscensionis]